jgi:3-oxoacyl-[acyl-carrier-protein] synthase-1
MPAVITSSSVLCAGGRGTEQLWATVRAGISCIKSSHMADGIGEPIQMGLVPADALPTMSPLSQFAPLPANARRMMQLATSALRPISELCGATPLIVYLALPQIEQTDSPWIAQFFESLSLYSGVSIDIDLSRIFAEGRAGAFSAIEGAIQSLSTRPQTPIVVGGVDSFLDLMRIAKLDKEGRVLGPRTTDGFIPGEGAAFLLLKSTGNSDQHELINGAIVEGAATASDAGHRYGNAPALGEGLANALQQLRDRVSHSLPPVNACFAGFNGENFDGKLWGVARLRHNDFFSPAMTIRHPADCIGDTGAAAGAILTALASHAIAGANHCSPALVWAASDHQLRGCALLSSPQN